MTLIKIGNDNGESRQNAFSLKISDAPCFCDVLRPAIPWGRFETKNGRDWIEMHALGLGFRQENR